jgi:hypothetical protein
MREILTNRGRKVALVGVLWCLVPPLCAAPPWLHVEGGFVKDTLYQRRNDNQPRGAAGLSLYRDTVAWGIAAAPGQPGLLDYNCPDQPAAGNRCIHWTGVPQYSTISFAFASSKDLPGQVAAGAALELWVRCPSPGVQLDLRFIDTKTKVRGARAWRRHWPWTPDPALMAGQWQYVQLPLAQFAEGGAWEGDNWYAPAGAFDWKAVDRFEIATDDHDLFGIDLYFDNLGVVPPGP